MHEICYSRVKTKNEDVALFSDFPLVELDAEETERELADAEATDQAHETYGMSTLWKINDVGDQ